MQIICIDDIEIRIESKLEHGESQSAIYIYTYAYILRSISYLFHYLFIICCHLLRILKLLELS